MGAVADRFGLKPGRWEDIWQYAEDRIPEANGAPTRCGTTECQHVVNSNHYKGLALDRGTVDNNCWALYELFLPLVGNTIDHPIIELFWDPSGTGWKRGVKGPPIGGHSDHVHIAIRPDGVLPSLAPTDTLRPKGATTMLVRTTLDQFYVIDITGQQQWIANGIHPNVWLSMSKSGVPTHPDIQEPIGVVAIVLEILTGKLGRKPTDDEIRKAIGG